MSRPTLEERLAKIQNAIDGLKSIPKRYQDIETQQLIDELKDQQIDLLIIGSTSEKIPASIISKANNT